MAEFDDMSHLNHVLETLLHNPKQYESEQTSDMCYVLHFNLCQPCTQRRLSLLQQ